MSDERELNSLPDLEPETQPYATDPERQRAEEEYIRHLHAQDKPLDREGDGVAADDDVPFHLPHVDEPGATQPRGAARSTAEQDDTDEIDAEAIARAEAAERARAAEEQERSAHSLPTVGIPRVPDFLDPQRTLAGSGGMDPNPDFTVPHTTDYTQPAAAQQYTQPTPAQRPPAVTVAHPAVQLPAQQPSVPAPVPADQQRYQRPTGMAANVPAVPPMPPQQGVLPQRRPGSTRRRRRMPGCVLVFLVMTLSFCGGSTLLGLVFGVVAYAEVGDMVEEAEERLAQYRNFQSTFYYDRNGVPLFESFDEGRRVNVPFAQFPQVLIDATIATEDDSFWTNPGIDPASTIRGFLGFTGLIDDAGGGSSITQQLVRNVLFDFEYRAERSVQRKFEEIMLALALTQRMTKQEILEMYLNEIYYGNMAYGAQAAAQVYFGKDVGDLTLGEAAFLAGLPADPANLDPFDPDPATQNYVFQRWNIVLNAMVTFGYITPQERDTALAAGLTFRPQDISLRAPHFTVYAQDETERILLDLGYPLEYIASGGYAVYTTVDVRINEMAQSIAADQVARLSGNTVSNAAVVILTPVTGEIIGMVGSIDYDSETIDGRFNVTIGLRQPGSTMKPFTYSAALEQGMTPGDIIWDTRTEIGIPGQEPYRPVNYDGAYHGPMTMRTALANSYNIPAVQTLRRVGVPNLLNLMQRFGVTTLGTDASFYGLSLTLGGGEISPLELTQGYAVFGNGGSLVRATSVRCIIDRDGHIVYEYESGCPRGTLNETSVQRTGLGVQVLDPRIAYLITDILADNGARSEAMGGSSPLRTDGIESAAKTGTTNDFKDNWTVGYTSNVAIGVWVGNNNGDPMRNVSGLQGAAPIWNQVITTIYGNRDYLASFAVNGQLLPDRRGVPSGMSQQRVCSVRSLSEPAAGCTPGVVEWFLDYPAGIPDAAGNLNYPQPPDPAPVGNLAMSEAQPGIYRALVVPLPPQVSAAISFPVAAGQQPPPAPLYCIVPNDLVPVATTAREQLFLMPPLTDNSAPNDPVWAEEYARQRGLAYLPTIACDQSLIQAGGFVGGGGGAIVAVISYPQPGMVLSGQVEIIGTVDLAGARSYKIEIIGGPFGDWTTIGTEHPNSVFNGKLEDLFVPGQPGEYRIRLVVIGQDANIAIPPFEVPFTVQ